MVVVNRETSRLSALTMKAMRRLISKGKGGKTKKAYIAWDDKEVSSSSSSEDEEANICLKASTSSSVSLSSSVKGNNYYQLLEAFNETHEEANRLALLNNRLKGLNNWLENRVKTLEEELEKSKVDFENLDLIYKNFACMCDSSFCENCESLEKKVHYLVKTMDSLTIGKSKMVCKPPLEVTIELSR